MIINEYGEYHTEYISLLDKKNFNNFSSQALIQRLMSTIISDVSINSTIQEKMFLQD